MQSNSIPPKNDDYIVGYAGSIPLIKEQCGHTFGDTQRLLSNRHRKPIWPTREVDSKWPLRGREQISRKHLCRVGVNSAK